MYELLQRFCALLLFVIFLPIFVVIAIVIKCDSKGPIFFKQRRIGADNKEFYIYKFRTMRVDTPNVATHLMKDAQNYITKVGAFLRKSSLDELPQILNIILGDMLFVGPRPALYNQYDLIALRTEKGVQKLKPGITGLAQISGRDELLIPVKVSFDEEYLKKRTFFFDIQIVLKTTVKVFTREGIRDGKETSAEAPNI